jgi:chromosomal replication initiation ATPase DnaA
LIDSWPTWPGGALALIGPEGSGKSHIAQAWAKAKGARVVLPSEDIDLGCHGPLLVEDADRSPADDRLFHLLNAAGADGVTLLLTARSAPKGWPSQLPDLRSRLNALTIAELRAPDDAVLSGVLRKLFRERMIEPPDDLIDYLLRRIERSVPAAAAVVGLLDEEGAAQQRDINRAFARKTLESHPTLSLNLFDP